MKSNACPIDSNDFANFLEELFHSSDSICGDIDRQILCSIQCFTTEELDNALKSMSNLRSGDENGLVAEMLKYANESFKAEMLYYFNEMIHSGNFDLSWHITKFQMLPKDGNLHEAFNWRPIASLSTMYKVFAKLFYNRLSPILLSQQSFAQHVFVSGIRIEDALLYAEIAIEHHQEFKLPL